MLEDNASNADGVTELLTSPADGMTRPQRNDWRRNTSSSTDFGLQHYKQ